MGRGSGHGGWRDRLSKLIPRREKRAYHSTSGGYSPIAPRNEDGERGPIMPFNGNGWGR
ncbi:MULTISPECIES: hypothetical protein [Gordonia]|uniref:Uncharacterized protein n=1 Tax=Gordonia polyisoprenivorans TaxID=84595 RepID=A0A846WTC1_9ACTN|nr:MULTISPECIES: hypothetical protein [Gordonia]MDF3282493.1 hypothetical protein [Gordonia sp. N1V]NKY04765.1 hypothetical protein [Gordonia polyisoprenivorans]